jgi:hypothetical protein
MRRDIKLELRTTPGRDGYHSATTAFTLPYRGPDPKTVAEVTNTLASFYIEENLKVRERQPRARQNSSRCSSPRPASASTSSTRA